MRAMSVGDRGICEWQAAVFESSLASVPSGSAVFVMRFMRSRVAARVDRGGYDFEVGSAESLAPG